jgi:hypothetical protein
VPGLGFEGDRLFEPPELLFLTAPIESGPVPCPSDIMVRRDAILRLGNFESGFRGAYEDVSFFSKLFLHEPIVATSHSWTRYRIHPESCIAVTVRDGRYQSIRLFFLNWFEEYLRRGVAGTEAWTRLQDRLAPYRHPLSSLAMTPESNSRLSTATPSPVAVDSSVTTISWKTPDASVAQVWISQDGGHETLFGEGAEGQRRWGRALRDEDRLVENSVIVWRERRCSNLKPEFRRWICGNSCGQRLRGNRPGQEQHGRRQQSSCEPGARTHSHLPHDGVGRNCLASMTTHG